MKEINMIIELEPAESLGLFERICKWIKNKIRGDVK